MKTPSLSSMPPSLAAMPPHDAVEANHPDEHQAKADMLTLIKAHQIKADKKRHGAAKAMAKTHMTQMHKVSKGE